MSLPSLPVRPSVPVWLAMFGWLFLALLPWSHAAGEEKGGDFGKHLFVAIAVDGLLIATDSAALPYSLRIVGGLRDKVYPGPAQVEAGTKDYLFRNLVVFISDLQMSAADQGDEKKVLSAHAAWEAEDMDRITGQKLAPKLEYLQANGRTWAYWTYDVGELFKKLKAEKVKQAEGPAPQAQHFLTTVVGKHVVVLVTDDRSNHDAAATRDALLTVAKSFVLYPKPLTKEELRALALQKQQP